jgi:putative cardiolipin synthase
MAARSLDVQSYIWHMDLTGRYFVQDCCSPRTAASACECSSTTWMRAKRTPRSRRLSAHPSIELRTFNPFASRTGALRFIAEATTSFERINRRMHNKSWIADNRIAIVGGATSATSISAPATK